MNLQLILNAKQQCQLVLQMVLNVFKEDHVLLLLVKQDAPHQSMMNNVIGLVIDVL